MSLTKVLPPKVESNLEPRYDFKDAASCFLEISNPQRIAILSVLENEFLGLSKLARKVGSSAQEVHRNCDRLRKTGFITKKSEGVYEITNLGKVARMQIHAMQFFIKNKNYIEGHNIGELPEKFIQRIGILKNSSLIEGVVNVLDRWVDIYKNASEYVFEIVSEVPPNVEEPLISKIEKGLKYKQIFFQDLKESQYRQQQLKKSNYYSLIQEGKTELKEISDIRIGLVLNEKEGAVIFSNNGFPDLRYMCYGNESEFHEWCNDYFSYMWGKL